MLVAVSKFIVFGGVGGAVGMFLAKFSPFGPLVGAYVSAAFMGMLGGVGEEAEKRSIGAWVVLFLVAIAAAAFLWWMGQQV